MSTSAEILSEIEAFLQRTQMSPSRFGQLVVNDMKFVFRLRQGHGLHSKSIDRARDFISQYESGEAA